MAYTLRQLIDMIRTVPDVRTVLQKLNDKVEGLGGGDGGGGIAPIPSTDSLPEGSINLYFSPQRVRKTSLTGLVTTDNSNVIATDTVLSGIGKLQAKASGYGNVVTYNIGTSGVKVPVLNGINTWSGKQTFSGGIDAEIKSSMVQDGNQSQETINLYGVKSYDMPIGGYPVNARVMLSNGDIVMNKVASNFSNPNTNMTGWKTALNYITPSVFGAKGDEVTDDSEALTKTLLFACANNIYVDGEGKTYACHSVKFDDNIIFKNANLVCNKYDQDLISVLECSSYSDDPRWLKNVYFENIHIDGKRELHTGIKDTTTQEDGGRSGFRFIRPVDGLTMINCSGNNCAADGIILFPHGTVNLNNNDKMRNIHIINSKFNGNRRHGGSSNSLNGLWMRNVECNGNGLDINPSAPANSGLRGDTTSSGLYGSGWDFEEYARDVISTNVHLVDTVMTGNAKMGALFLTGGNTSALSQKANIFIKGGKYDKGVSVNAEIYAISITPFTDPDYTNIGYVSVENVDLSGGYMALRSVEDGFIDGLLNTSGVSLLEKASIQYRGSFNVTKETASSACRKVLAVDQSKFDIDTNTLGSVDIRGGISDVTVELKLSAVAGAVRGALKFRMNGGTGGADLLYSHFGVDRFRLTHDGAVPVTDSQFALGARSLRFNTLHVNSPHFYPSDTSNPVDIGEMTIEANDAGFVFKRKNSAGTIRSKLFTWDPI